MPREDTEKVEEVITADPSHLTKLEWNPALQAEILEAANAVITNPKTKDDAATVLRIGGLRKRC